MGFGHDWSIRAAPKKAICRLVSLLHNTVDALEILQDLQKEAKHAAKSAISHAIDFIEYNMREMEIVGGNGD